LKKKLKFPRYHESEGLGEGAKRLSGGGGKALEEKDKKVRSEGQESDVRLGDSRGKRGFGVKREGLETRAVEEPRHGRF